MQKKTVKKVYVCGPPSQNIMFYELRQDIEENFGVKEIEIL